MKHSSQRTFCRSNSWLRKARHTLSNTPLSAHSFNRRWTALLDPYRGAVGTSWRPVSASSAPGHYSEVSVVWGSEKLNQQGEKFMLNDERGKRNDEFIVDQSAFIVQSIVPQVIKTQLYLSMG